MSESHLHKRETTGDCQPTIKPSPGRPNPHHATSIPPLATHVNVGLKENGGQMGLIENAKPYVQPLNRMQPSVIQSAAPMGSSMTLQSESSHFNSDQLKAPKRPKGFIKIEYFWITAVSIVVLGLVVFLCSGQLFKKDQSAHLRPDFDNSKEMQALVRELKIDPSDETGRSALQSLVQEIEYLKDNYYHSLTNEEIIRAMIEGLPSKMDNRHTYFLSKEDVQASKEQQSGEYAGIGCTVQKDPDGRTKIIDIIDGSPAEKVGLKVGDIFTKVDLISVDDIDTKDLSSLIKGKPGTEVEVNVFRPDEQKEFTFTLIRDHIVQKIVRSHLLADGVGYMSIDSFTNNVDEAFIEQMNGLVKAGVKHMVFDLRNNPGGSAEAVYKILDYMLPETEFITIRGRQKGQPYEQHWVSDPYTGIPDDMDFVILVNKHSASASELFSGTLRDLKNAILIGEKTYGKGTGTAMFNLQDGAAVNVTIFKYYLPNGDNIEDVGLEPDIKVELAKDYRTIPIRQLSLKQDLQLQAALKFWSIQNGVVGANGKPDTGDTDTDPSASSDSDKAPSSQSSEQKIPAPATESTEPQSSESTQSSEPSKVPEADSQQNRSKDQADPAVDAHEPSENPVIHIEDFYNGYSQLDPFRVTPGDRGVPYPNLPYPLMPPGLPNFQQRSKPASAICSIGHVSSLKLTGDSNIDAIHLVDKQTVRAICSYCHG